MTEQTQNSPQGARRTPSSTDAILDLLLDALAERQKARMGEEGEALPTRSAQGPCTPTLSRREREIAPSASRPPASAGAGLSPGGEREKAQAPAAATLEKPIAPPPGGEREKAQVPAAATPEKPVAPPAAAERELPPTRPAPAAAERELPPAEQKHAAKQEVPATRLPPVAARSQPGPGDEGWEPPAPLPSIKMGKLLGRLALLLALLVVAINIPIKGHGVSLARILPDTASLIIRDGLVLKGSGPNIYMLQDEKLRWISSLEAFEHLRLTWEDVHVVDDEFLADFEMGHPIHLILKCNASPHIYAYENGVKRWIRDIDTFTAEGYVWDDVEIVGCAYLRGLPDGPPIPEDAGTPPQP